MQSPFKSAWWSFDLGKYRPCSGTYELYSYDSLPPLDEQQLRGDFAWLTPAPARRARARKAPAFVAAAEKQGVKLPAEFVRFMSDPALPAAVPSCTACEWDPSDAPVPCRVVPGASTLRFLRDQQDCLFWYLHLLPDGDVHVLCSPIPFDDPDIEVTRDVVIANTWYCAPRFEHFVYRFWLENELWERLEQREPQWTPAQQAYLAHYEAQQAAARKKKAAKAAAKKAPAKKAAKKTAAKKAASKTSPRVAAAKKTTKR